MRQCKSQMLSVWPHLFRVNVWTNSHRTKTMLLSSIYRCPKCLVLYTFTIPSGPGLLYTDKPKICLIWLVNTWTAAPVVNPCTSWSDSKTARNPSLSMPRMTYKFGINVMYKNYSIYLMYSYLYEPNCKRKSCSNLKCYCKISFCRICLGSTPITILATASQVAQDSSIGTTECWRCQGVYHIANHQGNHSENAWISIN